MMKQLHSDDSCDDFTDCDKGDGRRADRKKRRGVIEKRRRDRINGSLNELKRLVPSAYEKQGSTKLEKAEILQMTVEHLRLLNAKGLNGYGVDPGSLALDYRSVGFRECVAEVARYLAAVEGMDIQDPLRMRLLGHLDAYSTQRDITAKANLQSYNSTWGSWSRFHSSNTSLGHAKYSYGLTGKTGLNQLGLFGSNNQTGEVDHNAYLAASRLGSAIGLSNHATPMTSTNLGHMTQTVPQQTGSCHFSVTSFSPRDNNARACFNNLSGSHHGHASMKLMRGFGTDLAY